MNRSVRKATVGQRGLESEGDGGWEQGMVCASDAVSLFLGWIIHSR